MGHKINYRAALYRILSQEQHGLCAYCGEPLPDNPSHAHVDHIIPHALSGSDDIENLSASHISCNREKADKLLPTLHGKPGKRTTGE